jgi:hypothetical protein
VRKTQSDLTRLQYLSSLNLECKSKNDDKFSISRLSLIVCQTCRLHCVHFQFFLALPCSLICTHHHRQTSLSSTSLFLICLDDTHSFHIFCMGWLLRSHSSNPLTNNNDTHPLPLLKHEKWKKRNWREKLTLEIWWSSDNKRYELECEGEKDWNNNTIKVRKSDRPLNAIYIIWRSIPCSCTESEIVWEKWDHQQMTLK